jgi:hypothetical protein
MPLPRARQRREQQQDHHALAGEGDQDQAQRIGEAGPVEDADHDAGAGGHHDDLDRRAPGRR